jgi:hypothetical protein
MEGDELSADTHTPHYDIRRKPFNAVETTEKYRREDKHEGEVGEIYHGISTHMYLTTELIWKRLFKCIHSYISLRHMSDVINAVETTEKYRRMREDKHEGEVGEIYYGISTHMYLTTELIRKRLFKCIHSYISLRHMSDVINAAETIEEYRSMREDEHEGEVGEIYCGISTCTRRH